MVIKDELSWIIDELKQCKNENPIFEAHLILRHFLKMSPIDLVLEQDKVIKDTELLKIRDAVNRRCNDEPLQYILNSQEFMGLDFYVDKRVLVPRGDTETLVEHVLEHFKGKPFTALDVCTGSGCIAISLAHFNKGAYVRGLDISKDAIDVAKINAEKNGVFDRVSFLQTDIFTYNCYGKYDLIVSNPPYIETKEIDNLDNNVRLYEPKNALDGGADGLDFYRHITNIAPHLLNKGAMLAYEIGYNQAESVSRLMSENFYDIKIVKDLGGNDRVVSGLLK